MFSKNFSIIGPVDAAVQRFKEIGFNNKFLLFGRYEASNCEPISMILVLKWSLDLLSLHHKLVEVTS